MKLLEKIKSFLKDNSSIKTEKFIVAQKSCLHCASRGMFVFNNTFNSKPKIGESNEKYK